MPQMQNPIETRPGLNPDHQLAGERFFSLAYDSRWTRNDETREREGERKRVTIRACTYIRANHARARAILSGTYLHREKGNKHVNRIIISRQESRKAISRALRLLRVEFPLRADLALVSSERAKDAD